MNIDESPDPASRPGAARWVVLGMIGLVAAGAFVLTLTGDGIGPPPSSIADDPFLVRGREIYQVRCASCHGESGRGDGPIAKSLQGPPPGDLTDGEWKYGDRPEQVLAIVGKGIDKAAMPGWALTLKPVDLRAVTAYVYHLAGRGVPAELRGG